MSNLDPGRRAKFWLAAVVALSLLAPGCFFGPRAHGVDMAAMNALPQDEMAKRFPGGNHIYRRGYQRKGGALVARSDSDFISVTPGGVSFSTGPTDFGFREARGLYVGSHHDDYEEGVVIIDDLLYRVSRYTKRDATDKNFHIDAVFAAHDNHRQIESMSLATHEQHVRDYLAAQVIAAAEREAKQPAVVVAAPVEAPAAPDRWALSEAGQARLERVRTSILLSVEASASGPDADVHINVSALLRDGSTMDIDSSEKVYRLAFFDKAFHGKTSMMVEVWLKDDPTIRVEQEFAYSFDNPQTFECQGAVGLTGADFDHARGMYYHGQPGRNGPDITVEIMATGETTADGEQILRYRVERAVGPSFECARDENAVFVTSATAKVHIGSHGGKGGWGVPRMDGDGTNGGRGGDGGTITAIVDPSVKRYNLSHAAKGGAGGNPSDPEKANVGTAGSRGRTGADGRFEERRATVEIP